MPENRSFGRAGLSIALGFTAVLGVATPAMGAPASGNEKAYRSTVSIKVDSTKQTVPRVPDHTIGTARATLLVRS